MAKVDRRNFLKLVGAGGVGAGAGFMLAESIKHPVEHLVPYPVPPEEFSPGIATWYNTVCAMCSAGCGISVRTLEGRAKKIEGNPAHPVSQGKLCALGQAGLQVLYNPDRLTGPLTRVGERGSSTFAPTTWEDGIADLANRLSALRSRGRGGAVALLTGGVRGHFASLLEHFMREIGSDRLLHYALDHPHALYAANERCFGRSNLPYYDIENARLVLSFGADFLGSWLSPVHHALGFGRSRQAGNRRGRFVQIEPRMSLSGAAADEWIPASPGTEGMLALGIARQLIDSGAYTGADRAAWARALSDYGADAVAEKTGIETAKLERLADEFAAADTKLAIGGGPAGNHTNGTDTLIAVNALNHLAGNLGRPGGVVFNPGPAFGPGTGARYASYRAMRELADDARQGRIEVLIVLDANPVFALPDASEFADALAEIPFVASLSSFLDETSALADLVLPSHTYLESWRDDTPEPGVGFTVGAVAQPVVSPLYDTRDTGDIVLGLAQALGFDAAFPWMNMEAYLKDRWRAIHGRAPVGLRTETFDEFWRSVLQAGVWGEETRAEGPPPTVEPGIVARSSVAEPDFAGAREEFPFVLHAYPSQPFHDGRGANLPWMQELPDPMTSIVYGSWVELNPATAEEMGVAEGDLVEVESPNGTITVPVYVYPAIRPDVVAMPIGQGHTNYGRYASNRGGNPIQILAPLTDPATGALASSATRVKLNATGRRVRLTKTGGTSRELGRNIVQTTRAPETGGASADLNLRLRLKSIPITVEPA